MHGEIACPLCRKVFYLDEEAIDKLLDNYFVPLKDKSIPTLFSCSVCLTEARLKACQHCSEHLCLDCSASHRLAMKLSGVDCSNDTSDGDDIIEADHSDDFQFQTPTPVFLSSHPMKVQLNASLVSSFNVQSMYSAFDHGDSGLFPIRCIRRSGCDSYSVLLNLGPEVVEFDMMGREINRFSLQDGVSDIIYAPNGDLLYSSVGDRIIWRKDCQSDTRVFTHSSHYQPFSLSCFQDGRIVSGGPTYHQSDGNEHGAIIIYDQHGKLIREIVQSADGLFVKFPVSISVSTSNKICVADKDSHCVFVFSENGVILSLYDGNFGLEQWDRSQFLPSALCHDSEGNIIVANILDGMLHVLSSNGDFQGYVLTKNLEGSKRPCALHVDDENRICVGNMDDSGIRIYEISSFNNMLEEFHTNYI